MGVRMRMESGDGRRVPGVGGWGVERTRTRTGRSRSRKGPQTKKAKKICCGTPSGVGKKERSREEIQSHLSTAHLPAPQVQDRHTRQAHRTGTQVFWSTAIVIPFHFLFVAMVAQNQHKSIQHKSIQHQQKTGRKRERERDRES